MIVLIIFMLQNEQPADGKSDILWRSPPDISLSDPLSSTLNTFELKTVSYSWKYKNGSGMNIDFACASHELPEVNLADIQMLALPEYILMDSRPYLFQSIIAPDILRIYEWDLNDIGNPDAEAISESTFYDPFPLLKLKPDRIYHLEAEWEERNFDFNGCYGDADYVFYTG